MFEFVEMKKKKTKKKKNTIFLLKKAFQRLVRWLVDTSSRSRRLEHGLSLVYKIITIVRVDINDNNNDRHGGSPGKVESNGSSQVTEYTFQHGSFVRHVMEQTGNGRAQQ